MGREGEQAKSAGKLMLKQSMHHCGKPSAPIQSSSVATEHVVCCADANAVQVCRAVLTLFAFKLAVHTERQ